MKLMLLRHGPAEPTDAWDGAEEDRPLTEEGRQVVEWVGAQLDALVLDLEEICTSPLARARETATIVGDALGTDLVPLTEDERLARDFGTGELRELLADRPGARRLLLVGHEPDLGRLVTALTGGRVELPPAGVIRIHLDDRTLDGTIEWVAPPRLFGAVPGTK